MSKTRDKKEKTYYTLSLTCFLSPLVLFVSTCIMVSGHGIVNTRYSEIIGGQFHLYCSIVLVASIIAILIAASLINVSREKDTRLISKFAIVFNILHLIPALFWFTLSFPDV